MTVDERDRAGRTPLHYAVIDGPRGLKHIAAQTNPELAEENRRVSNEFKVANTTKLLADGADVNAVDEEGFTPLLFAAADDSVDVVRLLLEAGANVNAANSGGETPLFKATMNTSSGALTIAKLLLEHGADPHAPTSDGFSPVLLVKRYGKPDMKELFAGIE